MLIHVIFASLQLLGIKDPSDFGIFPNGAKTFGQNDELVAGNVILFDGTTDYDF